jgi:hypothetical protein
MDIHFTARQDVSHYVRRRAERGVQKVGQRLGRPTSAVVRFGGDGPHRNVEIELSAPGRVLVGRGEDKFYGPALTAALHAIERQVGHVRGARQAHVRREAATRRVQEA